MARRKTLDELIDEFIPQIAKAFRDSIADVTDKIILKNVTKAIEAGDVVGAFRAIGYSEAAMRPLTAMIETAFENGGLLTASTFPTRIFTPAGETIFRFDVRNSRAEKWIREKSGEFITRIEEDIAVSVRNTMFTGLQEGRNPRNVALDLVGRINPLTKRREGGLIGLNQTQELYVRNMQDDLETLNSRYFTRARRDKRFDRLVKKAFADGKVDRQTIVKLTGRYKDNLLVLRGETIARDGAIEALNRSEWEALKQADDIGAIKHVKRIWDSSGPDGRTRDDHLAMDRHKPVDIDEPFTFPDGTTAMHPQDRSLGASAEQTINCRCRVRTKVDWLTDLN